MYLTKFSGATYQLVVRHRNHAFRGSPSEIGQDEFVLLSKNSEDCASTQPQIQHVERALSVRPASANELEESLPGVNAGGRWDHAVVLTKPRKPDRPFNLTSLPGINGRQHGQV